MSTLRAEPISTDRVDLLPLRVEHSDEMAETLDDPALHTYIGGEPSSPDELRNRYERLAHGPSEPDVSWLNWVIRLREQGRLVGTVQATVTSADCGDVAEIAWVVGTPWQGRGLATESTRAMIAWLADQRVSVVIAHVHPEHRASETVAGAVGLTATDQWEDGERRWQHCLTAGRQA